MKLLKQPVEKYLLAGLVILFTAIGARFLSAQEEDKGENFKQQAREELKRLNNVAEQSENITDELKNFDKSSTVAPDILPRPITSQKKKEKTEEEEKEEEEERNWLLTGVEKLSGERELTEEDRQRLLNAGANASLIDLYVLEQEREKENNESEEESKDENIDEEIDAPLASEWILETDDHTEVNDPLVALEKKYVLKELQEETESTGNDEKDLELAESKEPSENPYIEAFRSNGILDELGQNGKLIDLGGSRSATSNIAQIEHNPDNPLNSAQILPSTPGNYNPFLDITSLSAIPQAPQTNAIPEFNTSPPAQSEFTLPGLTPAKPSSLPAPVQQVPQTQERRAPLTDEEYERYFPQLEHF